MDISKNEYFFYEWLIIYKNMTKEKLEKITNEEFQTLKLEWIESLKTATIIQI